MDLNKLREKAPVIDDIAAAKEVVWLNPGLGQGAARILTKQDIREASDRLRRFAPLIVKLFTKEYMLQALSASAFRWYLLGLPFMCFNLSVRAYMQGLDKQKEASILTLINQLALPVIITWLLGRYWGVPGIFAAFAVHEIVLAIGFACLQYVMRKNGRSFSDDVALGRLIAEIRGDITTLEQVTEASEKVIGLCRENGVDNRQAYNIGLCLEELAANSLLHGFKDDREKYVEYRFIIIGRWLILRLRDNGRPFDLTERYKLLDPDDPASGMGLLKQSSREKTEKQ